MSPSSLSSLATSMAEFQPRSRRGSSPARRLSRGFPSHKSSIARHQHRLSSSNSSPNLSASARSSNDSLLWSDASSESDTPLTPATDNSFDANIAVDKEPAATVDVSKTDGPNASTTLVTQDPTILNQELGKIGSSDNGKELIQKLCCGGGCCFLQKPPPLTSSTSSAPVQLPDNEAFRSLQLKLGLLDQNTTLTNIVAYPDVKTSIHPAQSPAPALISDDGHAPKYVQPHAPYHVFSAPVYHARELTKPGAEKRTFHFDIDVTDYPEEGGDVEWKVGGAVGVQPPNSKQMVDEIFDLLGVPRFIRDKRVNLQTTGGRWPTVWGDDVARTVLTTRRELLTWCSDIQSTPPTKALFRLMAEHASAPNEKRILLYLSSAEGQPTFCDVRTGPHLSLAQLLNAFPSSKPPLEHILSVLPAISARFYSLSNDPHISSDRPDLGDRRLIEFAVTVHETPDWRGGPRTGISSGYLERLAHSFIDAERAHLENPEANPMPEFHVPLFRGLMANPLSKEFDNGNGPMMLIGAGVGMAPFRGFILNRMKKANCANKIWLVQGVRDSNVDELYSGELGKYEKDIKKVVQSRAHLQKNRPRHLRESNRNFSENDISALRNVQSNSAVRQESPHFNPAQQESRYVQDEVRQQADIVWDVITAVDGRVFVCGSSKGMGEGVEQALIDVAMQKGYSAEGAKNFWEEQEDGGKYVKEVW